MKTKSIKVEVRTWIDLKQRKIKKPNGDWETFNELLARLIKEKEIAK